MADWSTAEGGADSIVVDCLQPIVQPVRCSHGQGRCTWLNAVGCAGSVN
jgi:hypothetical protein